MSLRDEGEKSAGEMFSAKHLCEVVTVHVLPPEFKLQEE